MANKPNWVEISTLVFVVLGGVFAGLWTCYKFNNYDAVLAEYEKQQKLAAVREAHEQIVSVSGEVFAAEYFRAITEESYGISPISIKIFNAGSAPVRVSELELRVFRSKSEAVLKSAKLTPNKQSLGAIQANFEQRDKSPTIALIDRDSRSWTEIEELRTCVICESGPILRKQERQQTFNLLLPHETDEIFKIEVTIRPEDGEQWKALKWTGLSNPTFCAPAPFSNSFGSEAPSP